MRRIVHGDPVDAVPLAEDLTTTGRINGQVVFSPAQLDDPTRRLVLDLAANFLLIVMIPAESAGTRQVIKYSFHWKVVSTGVPLSRRVGAALGINSAPWLIEASGPSDAASYHLEVHAPQGLRCADLTLPVHADLSPGVTDPGSTQIAHAVSSYPDPPAEATARLQLAVPRSGLRMVATVVMLLTAVVFGLEEFLPGARETLGRDTGGAVAILLAPPAIVVALLARPGENSITAALLLPLRILVVASAVLLGFGAASFVGRLREPWMTILWQGGFWSSGTLAALLILTAVFVGGSE